MPFYSPCIESFGNRFPYDGACFKAHVFCHECGAQSREVEGVCYESDDLTDLLDQAVLMWQTRNARHRAFYNGGAEDQLNHYPRADHAPIVLPPAPDRPPMLERHFQGIYVRLGAYRLSIERNRPIFFAEQYADRQIWSIGGWSIRWLKGYAPRASS